MPSSPPSPSRSASPPAAATSDTQPDPIEPAAPTAAEKEEEEARQSDSTKPRSATKEDEDEDEDEEVVTSTESLPARSTKTATTATAAHKGKGGGRTQDEKDDIFKQRKRDREGSLEPGKAAGTGLSTPDAIPTKKNRLGSGSFPLSSAPAGEGEDDYFLGGSANESPLLGSGGSSKGTPRVEGEKVGQIRERVRDLSWKGTGAPPEPDEDGDEEVGDAEAETEGVQKGKVEIEGQTQLDDAAMRDSALPGVPEGDETPSNEEAQAQQQDDKEMSTDSATAAAAPKPAPPSFASFATKSSGFAAAKGDALSAAPIVAPPSSSSASASASTDMDAEATTASPAPPALTSASATSIPASRAPDTFPMRTQPTFSAFSSGSSPFSSSSSSLAGPSWLAGKSSGSASPFGVASNSGVRPSALGSLGAPSSTTAEAGSSRSSLSPTPGAATPTSTNASASAGGSKQLGFGAFASSSGFGTGATAIRSNGSTAAETEAGAISNGKAKEAPSGSAFEEALIREAGSEEAAEKSEGKVAVTLAEEKDMTTGEEDERTVTSARAKLYTMDAEGVWKERGTGTLRCNIPKSLIERERKKGGRLVMRAEGVYRLILNVALFKGMKLELAEKFVRLVAIEEGKYVHFAIKFSTPGAAVTFRDAVNVHIPKGETGVAPVAGDEWA